MDLTGAVVGINTMKAGGFSLEGISFAIPIDVAVQVFEQLKDHRRVRRPYLGLRMVTLDDNVIEMEKRFNGSARIATDVGVLVVVSRCCCWLFGGKLEEDSRAVSNKQKAVEPESPAGKSGAIKPGDVITRVNEKSVKTAGWVVVCFGG